MIEEMEDDKGVEKMHCMECGKESDKIYNVRASTRMFEKPMDYLVGDCCLLLKVKEYVTHRRSVRVKVFR